MAFSWIPCIPYNFIIRKEFKICSNCYLCYTNLTAYKYRSWFLATKNVRRLNIDLLTVSDSLAPIWYIDTLQYEKTKQTEIYASREKECRSKALISSIWCVWDAVPISVLNSIFSVFASQCFADSSPCRLYKVFKKNTKCVSKYAI